MGKPLGSVTGPVIQVSGRRNLFRRSYTRYGSLGTPRSQCHTSRNIASCDEIATQITLESLNTDGALVEWDIVIGDRSKQLKQSGTQKGMTEEGNEDPLGFVCG